MICPSKTTLNSLGSRRMLRASMMIVVVVGLFVMISALHNSVNANSFQPTVSNLFLKHCRILISALRFPAGGRASLRSLPLIPNANPEERVPEIYRRQHISETQIQLAQSLFKPGVSYPQIRDQVMKIYLEARLQFYPKYIKDFVQTLLERRRVEKEKRSQIGGGHFSLKSGKFLFKKEVEALALLVPEGFVDSVDADQVLMHEVEHIIQSYEFASGMTSDQDGRSLEELGWYNYYLEWGAMRAEWEFRRLIPFPLDVESTAKIKELPQNEETTNWIGRLGLIRGPFEPYRKSHMNYATFESTRDYYLKLVKATE